MNKLYCTKCNEERDIIFKNEIETYPVKGEDISINAQVSYCTSCGEQVFNPELDNENLKNAYRVYRSLHKLLQPEEIKEIRESYGLSQVSFARILGFGDKTIARYENGSLQEEAQNNLLILVKNFINFDMLLDNHIDRLSSSDYSKAKSVIYSLMNVKQPSINVVN